MTFKVIDNLLPQDDFIKIQEEILGPHMPWAYNNFIVKPSESIKKDIDLYDFQFTHTFYRDYQATSSAMHLVDPILRILNPSAIIRIKANLQPRTEKIIVNDFHRDHDHYNGKIAVFYINTNNGYTLLSDGTKIDSIENRLLLFDGDILHTGTTCTDQKIRCVINFMFYQWTDSIL